mgnify:CR=1 FL=1|jgi:hypothetical protein|nr:MAG TPA: Pvc1, Pvc9, Pvc11, Pvc12, Pvc4, Photorhabdus asymbiotica, PVC, contractile.5A [Caudoviricetes sp.]
MKGIILDGKGDLLIRPRLQTDGKLSGLVLDDTLIQDSAIVLEMNQGELKEDPVLGPNLLRYLRSHADKAQIQKQIQVHLSRAGIDYNKVSEQLELNLKTI